MAVVVAPEVALGALLSVAGALALLSVPVEGVVLAGLGFAHVMAEVGVPGHDAAICAVGVRSLEHAHAFFAIPEVVGFFAFVQIH